MKTIEEAIKAIEYRKQQLNEVLDVLYTEMEKQNNYTHSYFDYEARIDELGTLLEYIKEHVEGDNGNKTRE